MQNYYVYILANRKNGTLYIGMTNDLIRRVFEHKNKLMHGFTEKYDVDRLVYYEQIRSAEGAILREKQLKKWNMEWKINLIQRDNPDWHDLFPALTDGWFPPSRE